MQSMSLSRGPIEMLMKTLYSPRVWRFYDTQGEGSQKVLKAIGFLKVFMPFRGPLKGQTIANVIKAGESPSLVWLQDFFRPSPWMKRDKVGIGIFRKEK